MYIDSAVCLALAYLRCDICGLRSVRGTSIPSAGFAMSPNPVPMSADSKARLFTSIFILTSAISNKTAVCAMQVGTSGRIWAFRCTVRKLDQYLCSYGAQDMSIPVLYN